MKVNESCQRAFLGSKTFAPVVAMAAMAATPAREYAEVAVNISGEMDVMVWYRGFPSHVFISTSPSGPCLGVSHFSKVL